MGDFLYLKTTRTRNVHRPFGRWSTGAVALPSFHGAEEREVTGEEPDEDNEQDGRDEHAHSKAQKQARVHPGLACSSVSLTAEDLFDKLVSRRRGGYCFEQNLLLAAALRALGWNVELFLARVRYSAPPGVVRPRSHLLLRVNDGERAWHADVGFGHGTLLDPIPFGPGGEHEQAGWRYRVVSDGPEHVLQQAQADGWADLYAYLPHPNPEIDVETINWWVSTHPSSPFVTGLVVAIQDAEGKRSVLSDWSGELALTERTPTGTSATTVTIEMLPGLLAERFGLSGFELDGEGRPAPDSSSAIR
jgi:N-hydroxyarylamine O-acetyltransferase